MKTSAPTRNLTRERVPHARRHERRGLRAHGVVLQQGLRSEVSKAQAPRPAFVGVDRDPAREHPFESSRNAVGRVVVVETGPGKGKIDIELQPIEGLVEIRPFDAVSPARPARLGRASIADEEKLGVDVQTEEGHRGMEPARGLGPNAEVDSPRAHQRVDGLGGISGRGVHADRRAPGVVAVESAAEVRVDLRAPPRPEDSGEFRAYERIASLTRVQRIVAFDIDAIEVGAETRRGSQPIVPAQSVLDVGGATELSDVVSSRRRESLPLAGGVKPVRDPVAAELESENVLDVPPAPARDPAVLDVDAAHRAVVALLELIAVLGIGERVREVREEGHVVREHVGLHVGDGAVSGAPELTPERIPARIRRRRSGR